MTHSLRGGFGLPVPAATAWLFVSADVLEPCTSTGAGGALSPRNCCTRTCCTGAEVPPLWVFTVTKLLDTVAASGLLGDAANLALIRPGLSSTSFLEGAPTDVSQSKVNVVSDFDALKELQLWRGRVQKNSPPYA